MPKRRRRSFTPQFKAQVVLEVLAGLKSQAEVARHHKLKPELIARWKDVALEGLETLFEAGERRDQDQDRSPARPTLTPDQAYELLQFAVVEVGDGPVGHARLRPLI